MIYFPVLSMMTILIGNIYPHIL